MILIAGMLASAYFIFTLSQNVTYNEAVREKNMAYVNLLSESINITSVPQYVVSPGSVRVIVDLQNDGPIPVEIKTLWIQGITFTEHYGFASVNENVQPGKSYLFDQTIPVEGATVGEKFYGWIVTGRGKTIPLYPAHQTGPQGPEGPEGRSISALVTQGIGSISLDFKSVRIYTVDGTNRIVSQSSAFTFNRNTNTAFSLNVTNLDPSHLALNLSSFSAMWIFAPASGAIKGDSWQIATVNNNIITPLTSNQFITFPYNQTTTLYFGPKSTGQSSISAGITAVNLILTGKIGNLDYGQNLPFISLIAT